MSVDKRHNMAHSMLFSLSILCLVVLLFIFLLKRLKQPYLIAYVLAGIILGPHVTSVFTDTATIDSLGEVGIILLMFFLGLEIKIPDATSLLFQPLIAQAIKTLLSILVAMVAGWWLHWGAANIFLLAVILMFNSTAVVSDYLQKNGELKSNPGTVILNMLLLQDILLAPVLTVFQFLQHKNPDVVRLGLALGSSVLIFFLMRATRNKDIFRLPFSIDISNDHDLQVFAGAVLCFGCGLLAEAAGLTPSIGAFFAGVFMSRTGTLAWLDKTLHPFKVFFTAVFFVSIGLRIDIRFIAGHPLFAVGVTSVVIIINCIFSAAVFRLLRYPRRTSLYAGALLSQSGEFSVLACATAFQLHMIDASFYKLALTTACLTLLFATAWINFLQKAIYGAGNRL